MNKRFPLILILIMIASIVLSACGSAAATQGPVEITFTMWGAPEELAVWQAVVDDFHTANPNISVKVDVSDWDSYWTKLNTLIAGGTPPDVFAMDAPLFLDWQSRGALLNLQPYIDANPGFLDGFYPQTLTAYETADGYYGLPRDFQTIVLFYNKDMFDAADLEYPTSDWTYDDLLAAAKTLTLDKDNDGKIDQYGFWSDTWDMELLWSEAIWAYGGEIISDDHTKTLIGEGGARDAWAFIDSLYKEGVMPTPTTAGEFGFDLFQSNMAAMTTIGHWAVPGYVQAGINFDVAPMPKGPAGQATSVNSAGFVISKDSKNADAAFEFIKFALGEAGQKKLAQLGFAIPVLKSVAESDAYLKQPGDLNQQVFLDSVAFARMKPVFKGYEEWAGVVGDGLIPVFDGEAELNATLDEVVAAADDVLAANK
ncbi:MAG TPA: sugar ABC transporter substrate-binding protein [Anaerolineales bacterium]|jgi:multiple sugar transport system substrate-binding protein|nr:sugar ABC transporter substrate-binding protein [Anaerolineales bacterium]